MHLDKGGEKKCWKIALAIIGFFPLTMSVGWKMMKRPVRVAVYISLVFVQWRRIWWFCCLGCLWFIWFIFVNCVFFSSSSRSLALLSSRCCNLSWAFFFFFLFIYIYLFSVCECYNRKRRRRKTSSCFVRRYSYWPLVFVCVCVFCLCWHFRCEWWWWSRFHRQRRIVAAHTHTHVQQRNYERIKFRDGSSGRVARAVFSGADAVCSIAENIIRYFDYKAEPPTPAAISIRMAPFCSPALLLSLSLVGLFEIKKEKKFSIDPLAHFLSLLSPRASCLCNIFVFQWICLSRCCFRLAEIYFSWLFVLRIWKWILWCVWIGRFYFCSTARLLHRISSVRTFSFFSFLKGRRRNPKKKRLVRSVCACPMLIHHENEAGYVWLKKQIMRNGEREVSTSIKMRQTINALQMFFFSLFILCARRRPVAGTGVRSGNRNETTSVCFIVPSAATHYAFIIWPR